MSSYLRPRRGKKSTAEAQLTQANPLKRGEVFFEVPDTGVGTGTGKIKMGDGTSAYADLPYFLDNSGGGGGIGEDIHITLTTGNWNTETISGETYYVQNASAAGATSSTVPVIVPIYTTDTEMENYSYIIRVEPYTNILKFIATIAPTVNLNVVAKFAVESTADLDVITQAIGVDITQEDYDLLDPTEKNTGVYWITNSVDRAITVDTQLNTSSPNVIQNAAVATAIGDLSSLTTSVKSNLVGAVNELNNDLSDKVSITRHSVNIENVPSQSLGLLDLGVQPNNITIIPIGAYVGATPCTMAVVDNRYLRVINQFGTTQTIAFIYAKLVVN